MTLPYRNKCKIKKTHIGLAIEIKSTHIKNMKLLIKIKEKYYMYAWK